MTNIVVIGAGYAGVSAAVGLSKKFGSRPDVRITLIDRHEYHLYAPNLYEVATAEEELASVAQLKKGIVLPLGEITDGCSIRVVQSEVTQIDQLQKTVTAGIQQLPYDYLIVATGSVTDYFGIAGAQEHALPLKTLADGLRIRNAISFAISAHRMDAVKKNIHLLVAGGGYTGVEFAAELSREVKYIAWKNDYPEEKIEITLVEAMSRLVPGLSERLSQDAVWHLKNNGVRVLLSSPIFSVDGNFVTLVTGEKISYDVLVWTAGVKAAVLPFTRPVSQDRKGRMVTNGFLQSIEYDNIFAVGDSACVVNEDGAAAPPTAPDAIDQGRYVASVLPIIMQNKKPAAYRGVRHGCIMTLGGRNAVLQHRFLYWNGWFAYVVRTFVQLRYYAAVVGWKRAVRYVWLDWEVYGRND